MPQSTPNNNENSNFGFLKEHDPLFFELANSAEQAFVLYQVSRELSIDPDIRNVFHALHIAGNKAAHQFRTQHKEALEGLKLGRNLAEPLGGKKGKAV